MRYSLFTLGVLSSIQATLFIFYLYKKKPPKKQVSFATENTTNGIENTSNKIENKTDKIEDTTANEIENIIKDEIENTTANTIKDEIENTIKDEIENTTKDKQEYIRQGLVLLSDYKQKLIILNKMITEIQDEMMILRDNIQSK